MKCTVNQMQSTARLLSGEVIEILLATVCKMFGFVQDVPTAMQYLQFITTGAEKASRTDHQTQMQIHLCLSSQARVEAMLIKQKTSTEVRLSIQGQRF